MDGPLDFSRGYMSAAFLLLLFLMSINSAMAESDRPTFRI